MTWFVEERTPLGHWSPRLYHDEAPSRATPDGKRTFRADPVKVIDGLACYSVEAIATILSPDGALYGKVSQSDWATFLASPPNTVLTVKEAA